MNPKPDYFQWALVFDKNPGLLLGTKTTTASFCALISLQCWVITCGEHVKTCF